VTSGFGTGRPESVICGGLRSGEVHVMQFDLDQPFNSAIRLLNPHERERAERFIFEHDRRRFIVAHASLRLALGTCLNLAPESLQFTVSPRGKPSLIGTSVDLRFNLSHSGERALLALALNRDVGVDIEKERPIEALAIAERFFSDSEVEALRKVPAQERMAAFFRCWTRKEAFVKAIGEGLSFPLNGFDVTVDDDASDQLLRRCTVAPDTLSYWRVMALPTERPYVGAVAAGGQWHLVWKATPIRLS
jgi:4'-phosphopantetheinyl transferase